MKIIEENKLPEKLGKTYNIRLLTIYNTLWLSKYGFAYKGNIGAFSKIVKQLLESYSELQIAALFVSFFNWHGVTGDDDREHDRIARSGFSIFWLIKMAPQCEIYLRNVYGLDLDDPEKIINFLSSNKISI